jgi:hypothetical protein
MSISAKSPVSDSRNIEHGQQEKKPVQQHLQVAQNSRKPKK